MAEQGLEVGERSGTGEADIAVTPEGGTGIGFFIKRHYLHDLSVENPVGRVADQDLSHLRYGMNCRVDARPSGEPSTFLVGINMQYTSMLREKVVFLTDITYRVEVELRGIPEPVAPFTLCVNVPEAVFPVLQEILQRNGGYAGYPEMLVKAPDFRAMYVANHGI